MNVVVRITRQTAKAYFVTDGERHAWVPKAVVRTEGWDFGLAEIPLRIAEDKGLCAPWDWEPSPSTEDATIYVLRKYGYASNRMTEWLARHEKKLSVWLERKRKMGVSNGPNRMLRVRSTETSYPD